VCPTGALAFISIKNLNGLLKFTVCSQLTLRGKFQTAIIKKAAKRNIIGKKGEGS
jgi:hypothetical protein